MGLLFQILISKKYGGLQNSVSTKILVCQRVPKKPAVLACLTMANLKMNQLYDYEMAVS